MERSGDRLQVADRDDVPFLEVAFTGSADALVTGNLKYFNVKGAQHGVYVCAPAEFLARIRPRE